MELENKLNHSMTDVELDLMNQHGTCCSMSWILLAPREISFSADGEMRKDVSSEPQWGSSCGKRTMKVNSKLIFWCKIETHYV